MVSLPPDDGRTEHICNSEEEDTVMSFDLTGMSYSYGSEFYSRQTNIL